MKKLEVRLKNYVRVLVHIIGEQWVFRCFYHGIMIEKITAQPRIELCKWIKQKRKLTEEELKNYFTSGD